MRIAAAGSLVLRPRVFFGTLGALSCGCKMVGAAGGPFAAGGRAGRAGDTGSGRLARAVLGWPYPGGGAQPPGLGTGAPPAVPSPRWLASAERPDILAGAEGRNAYRLSNWLRLRSGSFVCVESKGEKSR